MGIAMEFLTRLEGHLGGLFYERKRTTDYTNCMKHGNSPIWYNPVWDATNTLKCAAEKLQIAIHTTKLS